MTKFLQLLSTIKVSLRLSLLFILSNLAAGCKHIMSERLLDLTSIRVDSYVVQHLRVEVQHPNIGNQHVGSWMLTDWDFIYGDNTTALHKHDGGIRPIVVGYIQFHLATKCTNDCG